MSLTLALPSKGRLKEQALEVLAAAGLSVVLPDDERKYRARIEGCHDIDIAFLSASEIAGELGSGSVDRRRRQEVEVIGVVLSGGRQGLVHPIAAARHLPRLAQLVQLGLEGLLLVPRGLVNLLERHRPLCGQGV